MRNGNAGSQTDDADKVPQIAGGAQLQVVPLAVGGMTWSSALDARLRARVLCPTSFRVAARNSHSSFGSFRFEPPR